MLTIHIDFFKFKPVELPKTTILLDNGYHPDFQEAELVKIYPEIMSKIQFSFVSQAIPAGKSPERKVWFCTS
ncbi:hypothetical protein ANSO36C_20120 [Nostoc cf. commune SO-36]|uniref:Uncharacterized protein n=2 Tax=Nostoc commune TaxID=1178 RepID=A0ABM7YZS3_NOSCO|nr:hypothetical protein ANSO36C_20120 [Nostoc cf. commune SO-36]